MRRPNLHLRVIRNEPLPTSDAIPNDLLLDRLIEAQRRHLAHGERPDNLLAVMSFASDLRGYKPAALATMLALAIRRLAAK